MSNPFAKLLSQAEVNLGELSRRAVESATAPVKAKSQEIMNEVIGTATRAVRTILVKAGLAMFAGAMLIVALVFALSALYHYLEGVLGPIEALIIMAAIFLVLAVAAIVAMIAWPSGAPAPSAAVKQAEANALMASRAKLLEAEAKAATVDPAFSGEVRESRGMIDPEMSSGLDAVVSALGEAGLRREQAGLKAGLAIAKQLKPMQLISLALLGGFVAGIRMTSKRRRG